MVFKIEGQIDRIIKLLRGDEESPIRRFLDSPVPENDVEYLNLWFSYFDYVYANEYGLIESFLINLGFKAEDFEFHYKLNKKLRKLLKDSLNYKLKKINFKPRLRIYIKRYPDEERDLVKKIILSYLYNLSRGDVTLITLIRIAKKFEIPLNYILYLNKEHPLFQDKILMVEDNSITVDKPFAEKELIFNSVIYNIFAGLDVKEEDIANVIGSPLIDIFNLAESSIISEFKDANSDSTSNKNEEIDIKNIEELIKDEDSEEYNQNNDAELVTKGKVSCNNITFEEGQITPYKNNLDYLHSEYTWIKYLRTAKNKKEDDMPYSERDNEKKVYQLEQNAKRQKNICRMKLKKSENQCFTPRLEKIASELKLSEFEKDVLKVLVVDKIFIDSKKNGFKSYFSNTGCGYKVGDLLSLLIDNPIRRVKEKRCFLRTSKLIKSNLIQLIVRDGLNQNLYDCEVLVDNRLIEFLIGGDYDISDYIEGGFLYRSKINLDNVILPEEIKSKVLEAIINFPNFLKAKKDLKLSEVVEYGNALVMLFVGTSGTGKTMLANAISNYLDKKILLFNFHNIAQISKVMDEPHIFSLLFREARINNAILFFDESEDILRSRINDLLIEIEKHEGIVIFATNASFKIDEAMHRRINLLIDFQNPGPALRKQIWEIHLPDNLKLNEDVDLDELARKFELNGGLIKNAVFSSLSKAVNESDGNNLLIKMEHLYYGAGEQLKNKLFMSKMEEQKIPVHGFESLVLPEKTMEILNEIVNIEKARKVLNGEWGFMESFPNQNGVSILFHGPPGTGKTFAAESIAYETGKNLKVINYAEVLSMWLGETEKRLDSLFRDISDGNSILLFDEADSLFASRSKVINSNDRYANVETDVLLRLIEEHNNLAILTTNFIENIDKAFFRRIHYILEFEEPSEDLRYKLWKTLMPVKLPLSDDVNLEILSKRYQFNGGDIKNAIIRASTRIAISLEKNREVSMKNFIAVCEEIKKTKENNRREEVGFR